MHKLELYQEDEETPLCEIELEYDDGNYPVITNLVWNGVRFEWFASRNEGGSDTIEGFKIEEGQE